MPKMESAADCVAVLVVHGIGAQQPGETLGKLLRGLRRVEQDSVPERIQDGVLATIDGQPVCFYEVYWADILTGDAARGAFQMAEFQNLFWFPFFNWLRGNYRKACYSFLKIAWWCAVLPVFSFLAWFAYYGAFFTARIVRDIQGASEKGPRHRHSVLRRIGRIAIDLSERYNYVDRVLDEYAGDVISYMNSAGNAFYRSDLSAQAKDCYPKIMRRFYDQLVKAAGKCSTIQIVAHSLGTLVTYHALSGLRFEPDGHHKTEDIRAARAKIQHIYTIGSPLEKVRFFWPRLMVGGHPFGDMKIQWDNFASWFDPIAGALRRFDDWGKVRNQRLLGGGFIRGHVVYERSPVFLNTFIRGLIGHEIPFKRRTSERLQDFLTLFSETLLGPAALAILLILGAGLMAASAMMFSYIFSWLMRWWGEPPNELKVHEYWSTLSILGAMIVGRLIGPPIRARKVHGLYWVVPPSETRRN